MPPGYAQLNLDGVPSDAEGKPNFTRCFHEESGTTPPISDFLTGAPPPAPPHPAPSTEFVVSDDENSREPASPHSASNGGPHSPTSPHRSGISRHGSHHSLTAEDLAHFNPLDELAGFFEAQLERRNPQAAAKAKEVRKKIAHLTKKAEIHRDKKKAAEIETIEYLPQDSRVYRDWLRGQPLELYWDRWAMMFLIGMTVGLCAYCLHEFFHGLAEWKVRAVTCVFRSC